MRSVCSTSLFRRLVDLDVLDNQVASVKAFHIGVGLGVLEKSEEEFSGFDWMTGPSNAELFACGVRDISI